MEIASLNLAQANRAMLKERFLRRQCYNDGCASVGSADLNGRARAHALDEGRHLGHEALAVSLGKEMQRQISPHAVGIADDGCVWITVLEAYGPLAAQHLYALIVAIRGMAAVADRADDPVREAQEHNGVGNIASSGDIRGIERMGEGAHLLHLAADQITGHVKIMNGHVEENAARDTDVLKWRRRWVAAG